jgi:hypothetical protein
MLSAQTAIAQPDTASEPETEDENWLLDDDVDTNQKGWPRFALSLGFMSLSGDGQYTLQFPSGDRYPIINLDRLGLDSRDYSHWLTMTYRSRNSRWGAWFGNWRYDVTGSRVTSGDINLGNGVIVPGGTGIRTDMQADWFILEATYSLIQKENMELGVGFGAHTVRFKTGITGQYGIDGVDFQLVDEKITATAPLPNILGYAHWEFAPRWKLNVRAGWFGLSYDKYDGKMVNLFSTITYALGERWELAAGYQFVRLDLDVEEEFFTSRYDLDFEGPMASLRFKF